ncbi:MAG: SdpI family protein [Clostridia bacterium]|nr:SdpI family protein [Clostridia bacterium]
MIKNNKLKLILSSTITLSPILFGIIFWDKLPDYIATHWGVSGEADGYSSKIFTVFLIPIIFLALFWLCVFITSKDPKNQNQNKKALNVVLFTIPVFSLILNAIVYSVAFEFEINFKFYIAIILGLMFILIGNYLPKCKQNYTLGVKIKWTLESEENWNATHRFTGRVWFICGILMLLSIFLPEKIFIYSLPVLIIPVAVLPFGFSYLFYKKQSKNGTLTPEKISYPKFYKKSGIIAGIFIAVVLIIIAVIMFTGDITINYNDDSFTIKANYYNDLTVDYEAITNIEYRENSDVGMKYNGFNSARLLMGGFENDEFGKYTRYSYTKCDSCVVITSNEKVLIISGSDEEQTKEIYETLTKKINR